MAMTYLTHLSVLRRSIMFIACRAQRNGVPAERNVLVMKPLDVHGRAFGATMVFTSRTYKHVAPPEQRQVSQVCDYI